MVRKANVFLVSALVVCAAFLSVAAQQVQTVGLFLYNKEKSYAGYTLWPGKHHGLVELIDNNGMKINSWFSKYEPGQSTYLFPNGDLLRCAYVKGATNIGGGEGGRFEIYSWDGTMTWAVNFYTDSTCSHHDAIILPSGNILALVVEKKSLAACVQAGFDSKVIKDGYIACEYIAEIKPEPNNKYTVVWEWHAWDHMVQEFDKTKDNYGVVKDHPELFSTTGGLGTQVPAFWLHANSLAYNADFDQIIIDIRNFNEFWILDHSTTTAEAKWHTGGKRGMGGDILYRWGNPKAYQAGDATSQRLYQQHDPYWIPKGYPGAGNILIYNNGLGRPQGAYSTIEEMVTPVDSNGNYPKTTPGVAFEPKDAIWTYKAKVPTDFYSPEISGAQRMPNGNTLICEGVNGKFFEVTSAGEIVWKYVSPLVVDTILSQGDTAGFDPRGHRLNAVFKIHRYSPEFSGFVGKDMTPKGPVEKNPWTAISTNPVSQNPMIIHAWPNPCKTETRISFANPAKNALVTLYSYSGKSLFSVSIDKEYFVWNVAHLATGMYLASVAVGGKVSKQLICVMR